MYNVEKYIDKCLCSCFAQDISKDLYEIIVVNDGSPDNSRDIALKYSEQYANMKVIDRPNGGLSAARNTGIDHAVGDYIMFLDSDDWIETNCLGKIFEQLEKEQPDILSICAANVIEGKPIRRFSHEGKSSLTGIEVMKMRMSPCAPFSITRRGLLNEKNLRFYEGIYHEDSEFTPRLYYYAKKVSFTNTIIYYVYQNPKSITRTPNPKRVFDIIGVVCPNLHVFSKDLSVEHKQIFSNRISSDINTALSLCLEFPKEQIKVINDFCYKNRYLYKHLKESSVFKYRIEGYLFSLFPQKTVQFYNLIQLFNKNNKRSRHVNMFLI